MTTLVAGLILFFGVHSVAIVNAAWRERTVARIGLVWWQAVYSLIAFVGLLLIIYGYGEARADPVVLYTPPAWLRYVAIVLLAPVFPLLLAAYIPGRIKTATQHPMLAATKLWAAAHLLANGTLADVLLFGSFLVWAIADRISVKHRAAPAVPAAPASDFNDVIILIGGLALYVAFLLWLHGWLFGVAVL